MTRKVHRKPRLLSSTRPRDVKSTLSSRGTRTLVRLHHNLRKQLTAAITRGDIPEVQSVQAKLDASGGLSKYQEASLQGQSPQRGGDTSKVLVDWFTNTLVEDHAIRDKRTRLNLLEVGALRTDNACSRSGIFNVERIDLHSQHPNIKEQDFMQRPLPKAEEIENTTFDVVSLSLVVNFVDDAVGRAEMLKRVAAFLSLFAVQRKEVEDLCPGLFLVLPAPCVTNSRYLDEGRLQVLMESLGYKRVRRKMSNKLVYYLFRYDGTMPDKTVAFRKRKLRSGSCRNNFAIVIP